MSDHTIAAFTKGTENLISPELIDPSAAQDSLGWITQDAKILLSYGRAIKGNDSSAAGRIDGLWFGYKTDGSKILYRKSGTAIQYLNGATWTDVITGLTANSDYSAPNYSSLAGAFTFFVGVDGIWKVNNASPTSAIALYDPLKNFKGLAIIDRGRMLLWNRPKDKTGLYGSYIDPQNATVYTSVTGEATTSLTGTLAFKAGGATRNCFNIKITLTGTGEVYTDTYLGTLTGTLGGTGTINYATGAYTISNAGAGTAAYQWEDSNTKSLTDFTKSATRLAGEGFQFPQDQGGDPILNVLIGQDGSYYSQKSKSFYILTLEDTDLAATNLLYRNNIGTPSYRAGVSTNKGIMFINTADPAKPTMMILQKSITTNNVEPVEMFKQFKFANYDFSDCALDTWERYIAVFCKKKLSFSNDTVLLCDPVAGTVDAVPYAGRCSATDGSGNLFAGHPLIKNVYQLFTGFDDNGVSITNYWTSKDEQYQMATGFSRALRYQIGERLKKYRKQRIRGHISISQKLQVYVSTDNLGFQLVGTILGNGTYVDYSSSQAIGTNMIGNSQLGGDDNASLIYPFFTEFKIKTSKFRKRTIKLVATEIGYVDVEFISDWDILVFETRLPTRFRQKQNVSLDGTQTDLSES
jgi:hypothetical protein